MKGFDIIIVGALTELFVCCERVSEEFNKTNNGFKYRLSASSLGMFLRTSISGNSTSWDFFPEGESNRSFRYALDPTSPLLTIKVVIATLRFAELSRPRHTLNEFLIQLKTLINKSSEPLAAAGALSGLIAGLVPAFIRICRRFFNAIMTSQGRR